MRVSFIVPVYNEVNTIEKVLNNLIKLDIPKIEKEIVIVEDNSNDGTRKKVINFCLDNNQCKLVLRKSPEGKGSAVRCGFKKATGDVLAIQDADSEYYTEDYARLVKPFLTGEAKFVLGSRFMHGNGDLRSFTKDLKIWDKLFLFIALSIEKMLNRLFNVLYGTKISDHSTMYKLFTRDVYEKVNFSGKFFEIDWEIMAKLVRLGYLPLEIPVKYNPRSLSGGKKTRLRRDLWRCLYMIISCRFLPLSKF